MHPVSRPCPTAPKPRICHLKRLPEVSHHLIFTRVPINTVHPMQALLLSFCSKSPQSDFSRCIAGPHTQSGTQVSQVLTQVLTSKKLQPGTYQAQKTSLFSEFWKPPDTGKPRGDRGESERTVSYVPATTIKRFPCLQA